MLNILVKLFLFYLLLLNAAPRHEAATIGFPGNEYRIEIYNTLVDDIRAVCYNSWSQTTSTLIHGGNSHNITFHLPYPWCCDFIEYNSDPRTIFQTFLVSNVHGLISSNPDISCGNRCSWKVDSKGFSVFYNGSYRRMYNWLIVPGPYLDEKKNGSGLYELTCVLGKFSSNSFTFPANEKNSSLLLKA